MVTFLLLLSHHTKDFKGSAPPLTALARKVSSLPPKPHSLPRLLCADIHSYYCQFKKSSQQFQR